MKITRISADPESADVRGIQPKGRKMKEGERVARESEDTLQCYTNGKNLRSLNHSTTSHRTWTPSRSWMKNVKKIVLEGRVDDLGKRKGGNTQVGYEYSKERIAE